MGGKEEFDELCKKAWQAIAGGDPALARQLFLQALALKTNSPDANYGVATACFLLDEPESATFYFKETLKIDPQRAGAHVNLGAVYSRQGNFEEAIKCLRKAIQIDPKRAEAYYNLGLIYRRQNQAELAVQAYREALHLNPKMADTHYNLANVLLEMGRFTQAVAHYQQALEMVPDFENARIGLENAKSGMNQTATPTPALAAGGSAGPGSGVRAPVINLQRNLDPQFDGPALHNLHRTTIEAENQGREFTRILEAEMEPAIKELSTMLLYPEKTSGELHDRLDKFDLALRHLGTLRRQWQKTLRTLRELSDKLTRGGVAD